MTGPRGPARFLTTVLFTDIVGSTEHAAELGDSGFHELIQLHHRIVRASLRRHGGRELDTAGDGFFAVFDAPAAAVDCALEIAASVRDQLGIEIRAGLHVGEVQESGAKVSGIAVVIGSRIMSSGGPSEVLVSGTVRDLTAGSGLTFEERGVRELKGVPGRWPIYAVARAQDATRLDNAVDRASRRAAAVRRANARPIWQRRPRLVARVSLVLAVAAASAVLFAWSPWRPPALAAVAENSVGVIDVDRAEVVGAVRVGARPGGIAVGEGFAWVTNTGADTISKIDLGTQAVVDTIEVGRGPAGIAAADGSIWVANSADRTVSQVNVAAGRQVASIAVGNGPTAIAVGDHAVWVANTGDSTIVRLDPESGEVGAPISVAAGPIALAVDDTGVWVVSQDGGAITHIDPVSGATTSAPIMLGSRPAAVAILAGAVWVAGGDGTVSRIDALRDRVDATIDIGGSLTSIAVTDRSVYVADLQGSVHELDAANPGSPARRITIANAAQALAVVEGQVWVATRASAASHRGGTLRVVTEFRPDLDPANGVPFYHFASFQADGLVAYRRVGGVAGATLLPDLAISIPKPTNAGTTFTFQLRAGLVYADGNEVRPEDFRRAIERAFQVAEPASGEALGQFYFSSIVGADACVPGPVARCDLSAGIVTDEVSRTIAFNLSEPDPDFLYKLAMPFAYPAPSSVPSDAPVDGAFPGTGPYTIAAVSETEVRMVRNPNFHSWDAEVRPDGLPDEIIWTFGIAWDKQIGMVERGEADYACTCAKTFDPELFAQIRTRYPAQLHAASSGPVIAFMNAALPPFDSLEARQAVSMAIDRGYVAELFGGAFAAAITCQVLPPGYVGYRPYCPYTAEPDPGGQWHAPDLAAARRLVDASGTRGAPVVVGPVRQGVTRVAEHLVAVLRELGYEATLDPVTDDAEVYRAIFEEGRVQIGVFGWAGDSLAPSGFLEPFTCDGGVGWLNLCDPALEAHMADAAELQTTDAAAAAEAWAAIDREVTDLAVWAPLVNQGTDFVSARVGNYQFHPAYLALLDQLWVQ